MINIFFDTEFSHLESDLDPEPPVLISIGCISESGKRFYAENANRQPVLYSDFVIKTVIPLLEGGEYLMPYVHIAQSLKIWIESFGDECKMWSDSPYHDWQFVKHMFDCHGWPENLKREPVALIFPSSIQQSRFESAVEDAFRTFEPKLRCHHALDDEIANRYGFECATTRKY